MNLERKDIEEKWYDPETGILSADKLYHRLNKQYPVKEIKKVLEDQPVKQILRESKKPRNFSTILASYPGDCYQMDIMVYDRYTIHNYSYILCVLDVYSRRAGCRALTRVRMEADIVPAIREIFKEFGKEPENINCDNQFATKLLTDKYPNIRFWFSDPDEINKNAVVERFNRTLARYLQLVRLGTNNKNWPSYLQAVVKNYNTSPHTGISAIPIEVWEGREFPIQRVKVVPNVFKPGDKVRTKIKEKIFDKGDRLRYSKTIYTVSRVRGNRIFVLDDNGHEYGPSLGYKPYELIKTNNIVVVDHHNDNNLNENNNDNQPEEKKEYVLRPRRDNKAKYIKKRFLE